MKLSIETGVHGRGVFAREKIAVEQKIIRFTGPILRYADTTPQTYAVQIGPDKYLGASGGFDDCVNHSCDPNAGLIIDGNEADLIAIRDIAEGEEIFFDYSTTLDEDDFEMTCHCGSNRCRGRIRDGKYLPEDIWQRYLSLGIIPDYVKASRAALQRRK